MEKIDTVLELRIKDDSPRGYSLVYLVGYTVPANNTGWIRGLELTPVDLYYKPYEGLKLKPHPSGEAMYAHINAAHVIQFHIMPNTIVIYPDKE